MTRVNTSDSTYFSIRISGTTEAIKLIESESLPIVRQTIRVHAVCVPCVIRYNVYEACIRMSIVNVPIRVKVSPQYPESLSFWNKRISGASACHRRSMLI